MPRVGGDWKKNYHNDYCEAMIVEMRLPASPLLEYRVNAGGLKFTQFDSFDERSDTYYDFKTRYQYLPYETNPRAWIAHNGLFADAQKQRNALERCNLPGEIVWIFDIQEVADTVQEFLGVYELDSVQFRPWKPRGKRK